MGTAPIDCKERLDQSIYLSTVEAIKNITKLDKGQNNVPWSYISQFLASFTLCCTHAEPLAKTNEAKGVA